MTRLKTLIMAGVIACLMTPSANADDDRPEVPVEFPVEQVVFDDMGCWPYAGPAYEYVVSGRRGMVLYMKFDADSGEYRYPFVVPLSASGAVLEGKQYDEWPADGSGIVVKLYRDGDYLLSFGPNAEHGHNGRAMVCDVS